MGDVSVNLRKAWTKRDWIFLVAAAAVSGWLLVATAMATAGTVEAATPVETMTTPEGTVIESYTSKVRVQDIYESLVTAGYRGAPAASLQSLAVKDNAFTATAVVVSHNADGTATVRSAIQVDTAAYVAYPLYYLGHEYGHVWSYYYRWTVWGGSWDAYLEARGLLGDRRLTSSGSWDVRELIAEDYRQLLAAPDPSVSASWQWNQDIPLAKDVPGLAEFLATTWTGGDGAGTDSTTDNSSGTTSADSGTETGSDGSATDATGDTTDTDASATLTFGGGWATFVAPFSGHTNVTVYSGKGRSRFTTNDVVAGESYRVKGPVTLTITAA